MPKYISGRVKRTPQDKLDPERYQYLGLDQAEPNIGDPPTASGTPGIPAGVRYQMVSVLSNPGERYWQPVGGGVIPGSITVFDEGSLVGTISSITQLNFVGNAIDAVAAPFVDGVNAGNIATMTVSPPGNNGSVLYKESGDFATSSNLIFNGTVGILTVGNGLEVGDTGLKVGVGGTFVTVFPETGYVGINEINPTQELDVSGSVRIRETIYDFNNDPGSLNNILTKGADGLEWTSNNAVRSGAGGTIYDVQYHNTAGLTDGAPNFVYRSDTSRVGIGSTQPSALLDVVGVSKLRGGVFIDEPYITGVATFTSQLKADGGIVANTARVSDLTETRVVFSGASGELVDDADFTYITGTDTLNLSNLNVSTDLDVDGTTNLGNVQVSTNTVTTSSGALTLNAASGSIQSNAGIFVNVTTDSTTKDSGALTVDGGLGVEKNVNIGAKLKVVGVTTLASAGGITTTGGDVYVGNDLYVKGEFLIEEGNFQRLIVNPGVSTFKGDVEFFSDYVGAAKSAYWDETANSFNLVSGAELNLGTSNELKIYHNGYTGNSYISESGSGDLYIQSSGMHLQNTGGSKEYVVLNDGGSVDIYYNNLKKFETTTDGILVTGKVSAESATLTSTLTVGGASNLNGNVNLGDQATDNIDFNGKVNSHILPNADDTYDLGQAGETPLRWRTIYTDAIDISGILYDKDGDTGSSGNVLVSTGTGVDWDSGANIVSGKAETIKTEKKSDNNNYFLTFVDSNNDPADYESLYTGAGIKFKPDTSDLTVDGRLYLTGVANNAQGSIWSKGGLDKNFVLYNDSTEGEISIVVANSADDITVGIASFKRSAARGDKSYFRSDVSIPVNESFNLGDDIDTRWNNVYAKTYHGEFLKLYDSDKTHNITLQTPSTTDLTADYTLTLPPDDGDAGELLKTDGDGNLDWIAQSDITSTPGGDDTQFQYNNDNVFGGASSFTYIDSGANAGDVTFVGVGGDTTDNVYWDHSLQSFTILNDSYLVIGTLDGSINNWATRLYSDGSGGAIWDATQGGGDITIRGKNDNSTYHKITLKPHNNKNSLIATANQGVELYYNNGKRFETTGVGVSVYGTSAVGAGVSLYSNGDTSITIKSPDTLVTSYKLTLPDDDGTPGQVLKTDGDGNLDWIDAATGSLTNIQIDQTGYTCTAPITITTPSTGVKKINIAAASNAYGRRFVQSDDPTSIAGGNNTVCDGDIWYDTSP